MLVLVSWHSSHHSLWEYDVWRVEARLNWCTDVRLDRATRMGPTNTMLERKHMYMRMCRQKTCEYYWYMGICVYWLYEYGTLEYVPIFLSVASAKCSYTENDYLTSIILQYLRAVPTSIYNLNAGKTRANEISVLIRLLRIQTRIK